MPNVVSTFATEAFACFQTAVQAGDPDITHIVLRPGIQVEPDIAQFENQCCPGYAYMRVMSVRTREEPTRQAPLGTPISPCGLESVGVQVEFSIMRCAPVGDENFGVADDKWNNASAQMLEDYGILWNALCCVRQEFANRFETWSIVFLDWEPWEVQGACLGSRLQFVAEVECPDGDCNG
jgi:hypothetical protein